MEGSGIFRTSYGDLYIEHHGILGQKWGIRRYQNPDGSLTEAGKKRYLHVYKDGTVDLSAKGEKFAGYIYKEATIDALKDKSRWDTNHLTKKQIDDYIKKVENQKAYELEKLSPKGRVIAQELAKEKQLLKSWHPMSFDEIDEDEELYREENPYRFGYSQEQKEQKLERAKNGKYDITFLEKVQNDDKLLNDNKKLRVEYKKYLNNPHLYAIQESQRIVEDINRQNRINQNIQNLNNFVNQSTINSMNQMNAATNFTMTPPTMYTPMFMGKRKRR